MEINRLTPGFAAEIIGANHFQWLGIAAQHP